MTTDSDVSAKLQAAKVTPISRLGPELAEQDTHSFRGEVTVVWPYSSSSKSAAFTVAEPDPLLRGKHGQIRINFAGACAQTIVDADVASGDVVLISLEGADWEAYNAPRRMAEASSSWQVKFTTRLLMQITYTETQSTKLIHFRSAATSTEPNEIVHSLVQQELQNDVSLPVPTPEPALPEIRRPALLASETNEYNSPAFLKRARISYGSLFEDGLDIFNEDEDPKGRGRKRRRFGRDSSAWRYSSQSISPERETTPSKSGANSVDKSTPKTVEAEAPAVHAKEQGPNGPDRMDVQQVTDAAVHAKEQGPDGPDSMDVQQATDEKPATGSSEKQEVLANSASAFATAALMDVSRGTTNGDSGFSQPTSSVFEPMVHSAADVFGAAPGPVPGIEENSFPEAFPRNSPHPFDSMHGMLPAGNAPDIGFSQASQQVPHLVEPAGMNFAGNFFSTGPSTFAGQTQPSQWATASPLPQSSLHPSLEADDGMGSVDAETQSMAYDEMAPPSYPQPYQQIVPADELPPSSAPLETTQPAITGGTETEPFMISSDVESESSEEEEEEGPEEETEQGLQGVNAEDFSVESKLDAPVEAADQGMEEQDAVEQDTPEPAELNRDEDRWQNVANEHEAGEEGETRELVPRSPEDAAEEADDTGGETPRAGDAVVEDGGEDSEEYESEEGDDYDMRNYEDVQDDEEGVPDDYDENDENSDDLEEETMGGEYGYEGREGQEDQYADEIMEEDQYVAGDNEEEVYGDYDEDEDVEGGQVESVEEDYSSDEEDEEVEEPVPRHWMPASAPAPVRSAPVFIDLISDSEDEDDAPKQESLPPPTKESPNKPPADLVPAAAFHERSSDREDTPTPLPRQAPNTDQSSPTRSPAPGSPTGQQVQRAPSEELVTEKGALETDTTMENVPPTKLMSPVRGKSSPPVQEDAHEEAQGEAMEGIVVETEEIIQTVTEVAEAKQDAGADKGQRPEQEKVFGGDEMRDRDMNHDVAKAPNSPPEMVVDEDELQAELQKQLELESSYALEWTVPSKATVDQATTQKSAGATQVDEAPMPSFVGDDASGKEDKQPGTDRPDPPGQGLVSPPATQLMDTQSFEAPGKTTPQEAVTASQDENDMGQLPTPGATQVTSAFASQVGPETDVASDKVEENMAVESVDEEATRTKVESPKPEPKRTAASRRSRRHTTPISEKAPSSTLTAACMADETTSVDTDHEVGITTKSLRSQCHQHRVSDKFDTSVHEAAEVQATKAAPKKTRRTKKSLEAQSEPRPTKTPRTKTKTFQTSQSPESEEEDNSIILARASLRSPSKEKRASLRSPSLADSVPEQEREKPPSAAALKSRLNEKLQHAQPLRDITALKNLRKHAGKTVNVLGVAVRTPADAQRPKSGPRDYKLEVAITDQSEAPNGSTIVHIYRPHKHYLPVIRQGDVVLLRSFVITGLPKQGFGLKSSHESAWAVYEHDREDELPQIKGPPMDISAQEEAEQAVLLRKWYAALDAKTKDKLDKAGQKLEEAAVQS